jgi:hypothetical protein
LPLLTDGKNSNDTVDGDTHNTLSLFGTSLAADKLNTNIDGGLLTEPHDLRACSPVPAHQSFVCSGGDKVFGGQRNSANAIQVPGELLQRIERQ